MSDVAIRVEGLGKRYRVGEQSTSYRTLREAAEGLFSRRQSPVSELGDKGEGGFWALKDVSLEVKRGQVLGLIGANGAGKSTFLKILSRITEPTQGFAEIRGRLGSLLEVGTGFHPELTGRENVYLNGAILGMPRADIVRKFDEIVAFAEIGDFLDTPVKRYSSGMYMRLAFSVAAHLEPDVLIVDEVLAVGDAAFQRKCLGKMEEVAGEGRTVVFVSHNMGAVQTLTETCVHLVRGRVAAYGPTPEVVEHYLTQVLQGQVETVTRLDHYRRDPAMQAPVRITAISVNSAPAGDVTLELGSSIDISVEMIVSREIHDANLTLVIKDLEGHRAAVLFSWDQGSYLSLQPGKHVARVTVSDLMLTPGRYVADVGINQAIHTAAFDVIQGIPMFTVITGGKLRFWLDRPWGTVHCSQVEWTMPVTRTSAC